MKLKPEKWTFFVLMTVLMSVLVFGLRPVPAYADDTETADGGILASGTCGDDLTWQIDSDGALTIEGSGEMESYGSLKYVPWYTYRSQITSIVVGEGVTSISKYAFYELTSAVTAQIGKDVASIGYEAFYGCTSLSSVTIPSSVSEVDGNVFADCTGLKEVVIEEGLTIIDSSMFEGCTALTTVTIPVSVTTIKLWAFEGCDALTTVYYNGTRAAWVRLVADDGEDLGLANVTVIALAPGTEVLAEGTCGTNVEWVLRENGVLTVSGSGSMDDYDETSTLPWEDYKNYIYEVVIEAGVTSVGEYAFDWCTNLESVTLPDSVTTIGEGAFYNCSALKSVTLPSGLTAIEDKLFWSCSALESVNIPDSVTSIGGSAFNFCSSLANITIPEGVTDIDDYAFAHTSLTSVTLPSGLTEISSGLFYDSTLESVNIPDGVMTIGDNPFYNCTNLTALTVPAYVISFGTNAIPSTITITGYSNSPAYYYANKNGNEFKSLGEKEVEKITVSNTADLEEAIGSYRHIILEDGDYYGFTLTIKEVTALTIEAEHSGEAEILSYDLSDAVVYLKDCYNVEFKGVIMGHTSVTFGSCGDNGVVLSAEDCTDVTVTDCDLFGCGTIAVVLTDVVNFNANNSVMRDCMVYFANVYASTATFTDCVISGNAYDSSYRSRYSCIEYTYYNNTDKNLVFNNCSFLGNYNTYLCDTDDVDYIEFDENCIFEQNAWQDETPDTCGICLNGITWSVEDGVLSLGYGLEYEDGTKITSATGAVPTYSEYSLPWKGLTWSTLKLAEGVTYEYEKEDPGLAYGASTSLTVGKTTTITASADSGGTITFTSSDTSVLTVDADGVVTALKAGTASVEITVAATDRYASKSVTLTFRISEPATETEEESTTAAEETTTAAAEETTTAAAEESTTAAAEESTTAAAEETTTAATEETTTAAATTSKKSQTLTVSKSTTTLAVGKTWTPTVSGAKTTLSYKSADTSIATVNASTGKIKAVKVGTVKITVTAAATTTYSKATATITVKVTPKATSSLKLTNTSSGIKLTWKKVTGATGYYIYRSTSKSGTYKKIATVKSGSTVTYTNKTSGTYKVTNGKTYYYKVIAYASTGKGTASSVKTTVRLTGVTLSSVKNSASKKMTVKWKKNSKATGYQIQYSTSSSFASGNKTVSVSKAATVSKTIGSLKKGKTYYVRIRAYKTVSGTKYYSAWSAKKKVKISK